MTLNHKQQVLLPHFDALLMFLLLLYYIVITARVLVLAQREIYYK